MQSSQLTADTAVEAEFKTVRLGTEGVNACVDSSFLGVAVLEEAESELFDVDTFQNIKSFRNSDKRKTLSLIARKGVKVVRQRTTMNEKFKN